MRLFFCYLVGLLRIGVHSHQQIYLPTYIQRIRRRDEVTNECPSWLPIYKVLSGRAISYLTKITYNGICNLEVAITFFLFMSNYSYPQI